MAAVLNDDYLEVGFTADMHGSPHLLESRCEDLLKVRTDIPRVDALGEVKKKIEGSIAEQMRAFGHNRYDLTLTVKGKQRGLVFNQELRNFKELAEFLNKLHVEVAFPDAEPRRPRPK